MFEMFVDETSLPSHLWPLQLERQSQQLFQPGGSKAFGLGAMGGPPARWMVCNGKFHLLMDDD